MPQADIPGGAPLPGGPPARTTTTTTTTTGGEKTGALVSPYNRMMVRDMSLVAIALLTMTGIIILLLNSQPVPGELWGLMSALVGGIVGTMGRYNGFDSGINPRRSYDNPG